MYNHTDFANSKNWLKQNIIFSYSPFVEPTIHTVDVVNLPFIHRPFADLLRIKENETAIMLPSGLEMELRAWDKLSDEAFANLENSK